MKSRRILALLLALVTLIGLMPLEAAPAKAEENLQYWIGVDIANQRTTIYRTSDNSVVHCWLCSTGRSGYTTPVGVYYLPPAKGNERKEWFAFGSTYVKYAVRYTRRLYFHSVLFTGKHDGAIKRSTISRLGHTASHGCIRLEVAHAKFIRDNCPTGTMVVIHKGVNDSRITSVLGHPAGVDTTPSLVLPPSVKSLAITPSAPVTLGRGEAMQLSCAVNPSNAPTRLSWSTSRPKVATVDANGLVTGVAKGSATITVTAENGVKTRLKVKVVNLNEPAGISLGTAKTITVNLGEPLKLTASLSPATAISDLTWKSSRSSVAVVDQSGFVTPLKVGSTRVQVQTYNRKKATVTIKVVNPHAATGVAFPQGKTVVLKRGETLKLSPVLAPATAVATLSWRTSKRRVATVGPDGTVTALKKGTARITVTTDNKKKAVITVKVVD